MGELALQVATFLVGVVCVGFLVQLMRAVIFRRRVSENQIRELLEQETAATTTRFFVGGPLNGQQLGVEMDRREVVVPVYDQRPASFATGVRVARYVLAELRDGLDGRTWFIFVLDDSRKKEVLAALAAEVRSRSRRKGERGEQFVETLLEEFTRES